METAVNYFAVFGGLNVKIDTSKPLRTLIQRYILGNYQDIQTEIEKKLKLNNMDYKVLTGISLGDRRINSAFKRADVEYDDGIETIQYLCEKEIIEEETSMDFLTNEFEENPVADKLIIKTPFLRFWFAFVSPLYKGIKKDKYDEFYDRFANYQNEFMGLVFEQLCHEYIKEIFKDDPIEEIGRFWNSKIDIGLLAQTKSGKVIVGSCKYTNQKIKTNELNKLKDVCKKLEIIPDYVTLFAKKGYTNELKALKGESLKLYNVKSLKALLAIK